MAYSGTLKAASPPEEFAVVIENYRILPDSMTLTMASLLPWLEVIVGFALAAGYLTRACSALASGMLLAFMAALLSAKLRGLHLPNCGCFGHSVHLSAVQALLLDTGLIGLAFLSFKKGSEKFSLDHWAHSGL